MEHTKNHLSVYTTSLCLIVIGSVFMPSLRAAEKPKVGVTKFEVSKDLSPSYGDFLYNSLLNQLVASGKYTVLDWEEIDRVLQYIAQSQPNISSGDAKKQAMMQQLGLEKMYIGSLTKLARYHISVKVLNLDLSIDRIAEDFADDEDDMAESIEYISRLLAAEPGQARILRQEHDAWENLQSNPTEKSLEGFLSQYPQSAHAREARIQLQRLISERQTQEKEQEKERHEEERLRKWKESVAGKWRIDLTPGKIPSQYTGGGGDLYVIPDNYILEIHQSDSRVQAECRAIYYSFTWKYRDGVLLTGTYDSESLQLSNGPYLLNGTLMDDGSISGTVTWDTYANEFVMVRLDAEADPSKYLNIRQPETIYPPPGGDCFIATAAYGSPWEEHVVTLRHFRDRWLITNRCGQWFVNTYYRLSPPLADAIARRAWARATTRVLLTPTVIVAGALLGKPLDICIVLAVGICSGLIVRTLRRRRKNRGIVNHMSAS